jgi:hypothetical protein
MGDLFDKMIKTTGDATRESGEDITWRDVDYDKLRSSRISNPNITGWDVSNRDDNASLKVNDSKGGVGGFVHPSTNEVRQSLRPVVETIRDIGNVIDPYTGFSDAFLSKEVRPQQPLVSSQESISPISQTNDSSNSDKITAAMSQPFSDDDNNKQKVGQIL